MEIKTNLSLLGLTIVGSFSSIFSILYIGIETELNKLAITILMLIITTCILTYLLISNLRKRKYLGFLWKIRRAKSGGLTYNSKRHTFLRVDSVRELMYGYDNVDKIRKIGYNIGHDFADNLKDAQIEVYGNGGNIKEMILNWLKFDSVMGLGTMSYDGSPIPTRKDWGNITLKYSFIEKYSDKIENIISFYEGYFEGIVTGISGDQVEVQNDKSHNRNSLNEFLFRITKK